ncbi:PDZ domain-containing protein [Aeoliella mucimassa]|uniref:PDZ domain (Also known as DHR or GLGF) n=1 Tax=Aeoliella mucimassa TaxID=2527972 RepID=A0A518AHQ7_9BACT|nr:PDZ domain-containing protein [Aeoliella mucimassa]QDU54263.1 PDZ domain (Also known as DHR or GLGF) [Aeoliella mucimassa]
MNIPWQRVLSVALASLLAVGVTLSLAVAQDDGADEGRVVPVDPQQNDPLPGILGGPQVLQRRSANGPGMFLFPGNPADITRQTSPYYIGVAVAPASDHLRAHIDLPEQVGLVVEHVWEGSPAEEAGIEVHDVLVAADGSDLRTMEDLVNAVNDHSGDQFTRFSLDIIRHGQPQTVFVTPTERPQSQQHPLLPHAMPNAGFGFNGLQPGTNSMSVQVQRQDNGPPHIVIERDGERWEIDGGDQAAIDELPEDLQPVVERMLNSEANGQMNFQFFSQQPGGSAQPMPQMDELQRQMQERMQQMENQLRRLEQQLDNQIEEDERA